MDYFSPIYGLVTKADPITENGGLFLAQYMADNPRSELAKKIFLTKMNLSIQPSGLYKRSREHNERSVSHDEITGMMASSKIASTIHKNIIWNQLKANFGAYPAVIEKWYDFLPYNPANYYAWGQYVGSKWSTIFLPFYFLNMVIATSKPKKDTSSKLIYWLELETMPKSTMNLFLKDYFDSKMVKQYGNDFKKQLRMIYFYSEDKSFPLIED